MIDRLKTRRPVERGRSIEHPIRIQTDITNETEVDALFKTIADQGQGLDILVANAGVHLSNEAVADSDAQTWMRTVEVNLFGAYLCCRRAVPLLKAGGSIGITRSTR